MPVVPVELSSWADLLVLHFTDEVELRQTFLIITFLVALFISILDFIIPAVRTKHLVDNRVGMIGTTLGLVAGLLHPYAFGIIIGSFTETIIGEIMHIDDMKKALTAAFGSFFGF